MSEDVVQSELSSQGNAIQGVESETEVAPAPSLPVEPAPASMEGSDPVAANAPDPAPVVEPEPEEDKQLTLDVPDEPAPSYSLGELTSRPKTVLRGKAGYDHGGHIIKRQDGSGVFLATSFEGNLPQFRALGFNADGVIEFKTFEELLEKLP